MLVALVVTGVVRGLVAGDEAELRPPSGDGGPGSHVAADRPWPSTTSSSAGGDSTDAPRADEATRRPPTTLGGTVAAGPVGPALSGEIADEALATAERVLRADLVGEGREDFGDYWGQGLYRPCCSEVVVHSGTVRPAGRPEAVVVSLVFSARRVDAGVPLEQASSDIHLVRRDGGWIPVHPSEGGA